MKKVLMVFVIFILVCCKIKPKNSSYEGLQGIQYKIHKIDSINNYYVISVKREDSLYKIISKKYNLTKCNKIIINENYGLKLNSIYKDRLLIMKKYNFNHFSGWGIDDTLKINKDSIKFYYTTKNLKGICYNKEISR